MGVRIAVVGDRDLDLASHRELDAALGILGPDIDAVWVPTDRLASADLSTCDGVWLAPGSPYADDTAVYGIIRWAREHGVPFLGTCGGMQYAVVEFARDVLGESATHAEVHGASPSNVVAPLACSLDGQARLVTPVPGTRFWQLVGGRPFTGMHYCSYGPTPEALARLGRAGFVVEASAPDAPAEVLTLWSHPFFVLTLFQPQIGAASGMPVHPIVHAFAGSARQFAVRRAQAMAAAQLAAAETEPRPYVHQMRGPRMRWWRPLAALGVATAVWVLLMSVLTIPVTLADPSILDDVTTLGTTTLGSLWGNLTLAALIPAALIGQRVGFGRPMGRVFSVAGRIRWRWLLRSMLVATPVFVVYLAISWFASGGEAGPPAKNWLGLALVTLLTTPLQATGEEVAFRGGLVQGVGAWIRRPVVAAVVTTVLSTSLFALAHSSLDPWVLIDIGSLAVAACYLAWRTGGLEAAMALHTVNNMLILGLGIAFGGLEESYVDSSTTASPIDAVMAIAVMSIATALLLWQARRAGIAPRRRAAPQLG